MNRGRIRTMRNVKRFLLPTAFAACTGMATMLSFGAEISTNAVGIAISGPIEHGDYKKLVTIIDSNAMSYSRYMNGILQLNSPGGDVSEAYRIAILVNESFAQTGVMKGATCASACFIIWAGGVQRLLGGSLGLHRVSMASANVDVKRRAKVLLPTAQTVEAFLIKVGIPRRLIDKGNETSPKNLFVVDTEWLIREGLWHTLQGDPSYLDVVEARCGLDPSVVGMSNSSVPRDGVMKKWLECSGQIQSENQNLEANMMRVAKLKIAAFLQP